jgi:hypothetical protein
MITYPASLGRGSFFWGGCAPVVLEFIKSATLDCLRKRAGFRSMSLNADHFTPLSRAVASIDRDAYAARFAVYDREHKALLRRLATADAPVSDAEVAREEQSFRDAIRRIEFADADDRPTLVPTDAPVEETPPQPRLASVWPQPRSRRPEAVDQPEAVDWSEALEESSLPSLDIAAEPVIRLSEPRSLTRRVGERLALAAVLLVLAGVGLWMAGEPQDTATDPSAGRGAAESTQPAPADNAAETNLHQPNWLSPQMIYTPPMMPAPAPAPPSAPRADIPLPTPRPGR